MKKSLTELSLVCACLIIIALAFSGQSLAQIDPTTCLGAWLFDDDGENMEEDLSGNGNIGTINGGPSWADGKFGKALNCDGVDDYVDCGDSDILDVGTEDFSIVAWIKCAKYTPPVWRDDIVNKLDTTPPRKGYTLSVRGASDATNKDRPVCILGLGSDSGVNVFGTSAINDDVWHHLAASIDRDGEAILYRDGAVETRVSIAAYVDQNEDNTGSFNIGAQSGSGTFQGLIDEVALFNFALTEADVRDIMTNGLERVLDITAVSARGKLAVTWASVKTR